MTYFVSEARDFDLNYFQTAIGNICELKRYREDVGSPGYYSCNPRSFKNHLNDEFNVIITCEFGTLHYHSHRYDSNEDDQNSDDIEHRYTLHRVFFIKGVKLCYDREGDRIDCPQENNDSCRNDEVQIPLNFYIPLDHVNYEFIRKKPNSQVTEDENFGYDLDAGNLHGTSREVSRLLNSRSAILSDLEEDEEDF